MRRSASSCRLVSLVVLAACFALLAGARRAEAGTTAIPQRPIGTPIVDQVGVLSATGRQRLTDLNDRLVAERDGAEIGVVIVKTLSGDVPRTFATSVYNAWGLGAAATDNGAIIMIATDDHKVELVLGDGVDDDAGIAASRAIVSEYLVPAFKRGDFEAGILDGADRTATEILGLAETSATTDTTDADQSTGSSADMTPAPSEAITVASPAPAHKRSRRPLIGIIAGVAAAAALGPLGVSSFRRFRRNHPRPCPGCAKPMVRLGENADDAKLEPGQRTEERIGSVDYDVWACGACNRALVLRYGRLSTGYKPCPQCGATTMSAASTTLQSPTTESYGVARIDETCVNCSYTSSHTNSIPRTSTSSSSSAFGSSSSFSASNSFGSGSSFGSDSSSSGGGGHSSGGGSSGSW